MRVLVDGNEVAHQELSFPIRLGSKKWSRGTIGADLAHQNNGALQMGFWGVGHATMPNKNLNAHIKNVRNLLNTLGFRPDASAEVTSPPAQPPQVSVTNSPGSIIAPSGGRNSVTNNFGPAPASAQQLQENPIVANSDGSFTRTYLVKTTASTPQNNVAFLVKGKTVLDIDVNGVGTGAAIRAGRGKTQDGWYFDAFSVPTVGQWNVGARTSDKTTPFVVKVIFNASIK